MGKTPKSLKKSALSSKEAQVISESLNQDSSLKRKRVNFDENEDLQYEMQPRTERSIELNNDDDGPEILNSNDISIQQLKELHNSITTDKKIKKKKSRIVDSSKTFDVSIFDQTNIPDHISTTQVKESSKPVVINNISSFPIRSKKIGNVEVVALEDKTDFFASFKMDKAAEEFSKTIISTKPRISFSRFSAQKKAIPSKLFRKSNT